MNADWIIAAFIVIDTVLECLEHRRRTLTQVLDADIVTVVVVAAKFFPKYHERSLCVLRVSGYLSGTLSVSRFNCLARRALACPPASHGMSASAPAMPWPRAASHTQCGAPTDWSQLL